MNGKRVLVADDEAHLIYILSFKLKQIGLDVITAGDGEEAYALACERMPDLVITDYEMPHISGLELCVKLKENHQTAEIPVLMLTARGHKLSTAEIAQTNIRHMISKPFSVRELLAKISVLLPRLGSDDVALSSPDRRPGEAAPRA